MKHKKFNFSNQTFLNKFRERESVFSEMVSWKWERHRQPGQYYRLEPFEAAVNAGVADDSASK